MLRNSQQGCEMENTCTSIYFVRHGDTDYSCENMLQRDQNLPLNTIGREQATKTAQFLKTLLSCSLNPKMVSSSLKRASQTARIIEKIAGIALNAKQNELREFYNYSKIKDLSQIPPDAETEEEFRKRVSQVIDELLLEYNQADPLIIVSHQHVFKYFAEVLTQCQASLPNAGIAHFSRNENGEWTLNVLDIKEEIVNLPTSFMRDLFPKKQEKSSNPVQQAPHKMIP